MGFSRSHNDELNSVVRGIAGADTPMLIQDFGASLSMAIQNNVVPMSIRDDESLCLEISFFKKTFLIISLLTDRRVFLSPVIICAIESNPHPRDSSS